LEDFVDFKRQIGRYIKEAQVNAFHGYYIWYKAYLCFFLSRIQSLNMKTSPLPTIRPA
jgi:hypothetical protein